MEFITTLKHSFSWNLPWFPWNFSFQVNLVEKSIFSVFETISGYCSSIWMDSNSTWKFSKIHENFSLESFQAQEVNRQNPEPGAQKTQIFKVLRFEPNFRGRMYMTSKGTPFPNFIKKPLTKLFIHDSSGLYAFPQVLSLIDTSSSKFSPIAPQFWDLVSNPS